MTRRPSSTDELLREMQSAVIPVDSLDAAQQRRNRTISNLKQLQSTAHGERRAARLRRRATIAAGALVPILAAGLAFAVSRARLTEKTDAPAPAAQPAIARPTEATAAAPVPSPARVEDEPARNRPETRQEAPARSRPKVVLASNASFPEGDAREHENASGAVAKATSTLSEENGLMEHAMMASRAGDDRRALAILDTLLTRFPHSVLKEDAQVERLRALRRLGAAGEAAEQALR